MSDQMPLADAYSSVIAEDVNNTRTAILLGLLMVTTAFIALPSASAKPLPVDCSDAPIIVHP